MRMPSRVIVACAALLLLAPAGLVSGAEDNKEKGEKTEQNQKSEESARQWAKQMTAAWDKHDAKALAALYAEDGDLTTPEGDDIEGRESIERFHGDLFRGGFKDSKLTVTVKRVRIVKGDVALLDADGVIEGIKNDDGGNAESARFRLVVVLVRHGDQWLSAATRPIFERA